MDQRSLTARSIRLFVIRHCLTCLLLAAVSTLSLQTAGAQTILPPGFQDSVVLQGLNAPTAVAFAPDGRVFVAEKGGIIKVFAYLGDTAPTVFADLRTEVNDYHDRGLLGLAIDPAFPGRPYIYVLYTRDAPPGGSTPTWGQPGMDGDSCPDEINGCVVTGRLARLEAEGSAWTGRMDVLVDGWTQQFDSHSIGSLAFGPDGALYASGGDGASWQFVDYGQSGSPLNPAGDPPSGVGGVMTPPYAEGGALRAQDLRTDGDPVGLNGAVIRIDPSTGAGLPDNPLWYHPDPNARRIVAHGFRNPFRMTVRPGTSEVWVGDVGWRIAEEINVLPQPGAGVAANFGWPCYEGSMPQPGYQAAGLAICEQLYLETGAVSPPHFQYARGGFAGPGDDGCGNANGSLSGLAFYDGGSYPEAYRGVLFFADYTRRCIWAMHPRPDGTPSAEDVRTFGRSAAFPVDLKQGPGGDLFYVDIVGGTIHRIEYRENLPPRAMLRVSPSSGPAPLTVLLDGQESFDPEGAALTYEWDIDGDNTFEPGGASRSHVFESDGTYYVRLRVTDDAGGADVASVEVVVGAAVPTAVIETPVAGLLWRAGDAYSFSGYATDPQEGLLGPGRLNWRLVMHHCSAPASCHEHLIQAYFGVVGGSFVAPEHEYPSYLTIELVATDRDGHQHQVERRIDPQPLQVVLRAEPAGLRVAFGDELLHSGESRTMIAGSRQTLSAPSPQTIAGVTYVFSSWSDGGAQTHLARFDADITLTASFEPIASVQPAEWTASDIGDVGLTGSATMVNDILTLRGAGDDVWNSADGFHYAWRTLQGDGAITAHVSLFDGVDPWSKAGLMIRGSTASDAAHAFLLVSRDNGTAFQRRTATGAATTHTAVIAVQWLRLERTGDLVTASISPDGLAWYVVAQDTIQLPPDVLIGLAVTSHDRTRLASAAFSSVAVTAPVNPPSDGTEVPPALPAEWTASDIGDVGLTGSATMVNDILTLRGAGDDVWNSADGFHYAWQRLHGDGAITAHVSLFEGVNPWSKAGLMIRGSTASDAAHAFLLVSRDNGTAFQRRTATGEATTHTAVVAVQWLRLERTGDLVTASISPDGLAWYVVAQDTIQLPPDVLIGLAVTSHDRTRLASAAFSSVAVTAPANPPSDGTEVPPALPAEWTASDIGDVGLTGSATMVNDILTLQGAGDDVWNTADAFRYAWRTLHGDGAITAHVSLFDGVDPWSKAGLMLRGSTAADAAHAFLLVSRDNGTAFQRRTATGEATTHTAVVAVQWLRLERTGDLVTASISPDGLAWYVVAQDTIQLPPDVLIGLAVTSHDRTRLASAAFSSVAVTAPANP